MNHVEQPVIFCQSSSNYPQVLDVFRIEYHIISEVYLYISRAIYLTIIARWGVVRMRDTFITFVLQNLLASNISRPPILIHCFHT